MIIQQVDFGKQENTKLWYRKDEKVKMQDGRILFGEGGMLSTDTYYASFSIGKWKEYCNFREFYLNVVFGGAFKLTVYQSKAIADEVVNTKLLEEELISDTEKQITLLLPKTAEGVIYFTLEAVRAESYVKQMFYEGICDKKNEVTIALNICTFRREAELIRNLTLLREALLENEKEELKDRLKVFVTDNGSTIDIEKYGSDKIFIHPNENVGGAGGFTRGLVEILKKKETHEITHVIFMDDDIEFDVEAIKRTYLLLCAMKEEYKTAFIAGAMLRLDNRDIQNENGAWWNYGGVILRNSNMDLSEFSNVVRNEQIEEVDYAAWFYCCMPVDVVTKQNLPLPIFIHDDDIEYSLRNTKQIITLNGIAVAHPVVTHKSVSTNSYYDLRNALIVNTCYYKGGYTKKAARKLVIKAMLLALLRYRYKDMQLISLALKDFCRGPEWLYQLDGAAYHKELQKMGYTFYDVTEELKGQEEVAAQYEHTKGFVGQLKEADLKGKLKVIVQMLSLNGWLLPAKQEKGIFYMNVRPMHLYRKKQVLLYDDGSMQGLLVEKSYKECFHFMKLALEACWLIEKKFVKTQKAYYNTIGKLCSIDYWDEKYQYSKR